LIEARRAPPPVSHCRRENLRTERRTGAAFPSPFRFNGTAKAAIESANCFRMSPNHR